MFKDNKARRSAECEVRGAGCLVPSTKYQVPSSQYVVPSTQHLVLSTKHLVLSTRHFALRCVGSINNGFPYCDMFIKEQNVNTYTLTCTLNQQENHHVDNTSSY